MNNAPAILRTFIIYALCVPVAVFIGYLLANPLDYSTIAMYGTLVLVLCFPLLLRWHHWVLLLSWYFTMNLFFLKGSPPPWMVMTALSLGISVLQRALTQQSRFIRVPAISLSLIFMAVVVLGTAKLTGGFGLRVLGSEVYGGRKYLYTICAIVGYFALTAVRIPPRRAGLAVALFFLGSMTNIIGDLYMRLPSSFNFLFWFFPPNFYGAAGPEDNLVRIGGAMGFATGICSYMLAHFGIRGIFLGRKPWRWIVFGLVTLMGLMGGYRYYTVILALTFLIQFFLEGMHRTKLLPIFGMLGIAALLLMIPLMPRMPFSVQRALSFLPLPIDNEAKMSAQDTMDWRFEMWKGLLPQVPRHLLLGKGYGFSAEDFLFMGRDTAFHAIDSSQQSMALSMDYHNGWLSVLLTFGLWGMIAFLWFAAAGIYVLYCNYRYGDAPLQSVNAFLLAAFIVRFLLFMSVSGSGLHADMCVFTGWLGLGVSLNGGVCHRPMPQPAQKQPLSPVKPFPRPRPAFQH